MIKIKFASVIICNGTIWILQNLLENFSEDREWLVKKILHNIFPEFQPTNITYAQYKDLLPKNNQQARTYLTCELCGHEPRNGHRRRHLMRSHFKHIYDDSNNCPIATCSFVGITKEQNLGHCSMYKFSLFRNVNYFLLN